MDYYKRYTEAYHNTYLIKREYLEHAVFVETSAMNEQLGNSFISNEDFDRFILPFWQKYNETPDKCYFEFYGSRDSVIDPLFIPKNIYVTKLLPYLNNLTFLYAYDDKCTNPERFPMVKQAKTIIRCMSGLFYDDRMNMISRDKAISLCLAHNNKLVCKPSIYTSFGNGILVIDPACFDYEKMSDTFLTLGANFIVQDRIRQHPALEKLNPSTVNTIRVNSLLSSDGVYIPYTTIRVGGKNEAIVGEGNDGWICEINSDNTLHSKSIPCIKVNKENDYTGLKWQKCPFSENNGERYVVPSMDKVRDIIQKLHPLIPHFRWAGWDFTVDDEGDPVLIEVNLMPGDMTAQFAACKPMFGKMTEAILDDYYIHRTLEKNQRQERLFE